MARPRSLTKNVSIDVAKRRHACQHSDDHPILAGDKRLTVKEDRSEERYCLACAEKFLVQSIARLQALLEEVRNAKANPSGGG